MSASSAKPKKENVMNKKEMKAVEKIAESLGCVITNHVNNGHNKFFVTHVATGTKVLIVTSSTPKSGTVDMYFAKDLKRELNKSGI